MKFAVTPLVLTPFVPFRDPLVAALQRRRPAGAVERDRERRLLRVDVREHGPAGQVRAQPEGVYIIMYIIYADIMQYDIL